MNQESTEKIATAAGNLVRAVESLSLVGSRHLSSQATTNDHLASSNEHLVGVNAGLETVGHHVEGGNQALLDAVKELSDKVENLDRNIKEEFKSSREAAAVAAAEADKIRRIEFGLQNNGLTRVFYPGKIAGRNPLLQMICNRVDSKCLLIDILFSFRKGDGFNVSKYVIPPHGSLATHPICYIPDANMSESFERFRDTVVDSIHSLLGLKPRIEKYDDDQVFIYYS